MVFRPEEVDRRSDRIEGLTPVVTALAEPDHHALGVRPHSLRRSGEVQRLAAMMAGRRNVDRLADHRRDAERVGRATGIPLASGGEAYAKRRWRGRERVGHVDLTGADTDQVVSIESHERLLAIRRACDDVVDWDRSTSLDECRQDESDERLLARRPSCELALQGIESLQLVSRHDYGVRHERPQDNALAWVPGR